MADELGVRVVHFNNVHRERQKLLREADVVVLNAVCDPDLFPVFAERKTNRRLTVYEVNDDFRAVQPSNPIHGYFQNPDNVRLLLRLARDADANQYSAGELERLYGYLNAHRAVFTNQLAAMPAPREPRRERPVVIGWGGSLGHLDDLRAIAPALVAFLERRDDAVLSVMCAESIAQVFDELPAAKLRRTEPGSIDAYYKFVGTLDIGIAPLLDAGFNRCRSDVKYLEYAAHSVAAVVQELVPYLGSVRDGETGFFFRTPSELVAVLERLLDDAELRCRVARRGYDAVAHTRTQAEHARARVDFYRDALARIGHESRADVEVGALFAEVAALDGAEVLGNLAMLGATSFETLMHDALMLSQRDISVRDASTMLNLAADRRPDDYLPRLVKGATRGDLSELEAALVRGPRSIQAHVALGTYFAQLGDVRALSLFLKAAELYPAYEIPYLRAAGFLRSKGHEAEAQEFERNATALVRGLERA